MRKGWVTRKLGDIATKIGSGATPKGGEAAYKSNGLSLIRSLNVYDDGFRPAKLAKIDDDQARKLSNVVVEPNDVLLNITGASVARCCLAPQEYLPARVNQHVSIIRVPPGTVLPTYLQYQLTSPSYKKRLLQTGDEGGSTRQAITKAQIQGFEIQYPESLSEQERIVAFLDEAFAGIATAKAHAERNLQNARALFESHLNAIFTQGSQSAAEGGGEGWVEKRLVDLCEAGRIITYGVIKLGDEVKGGIPCLRTSNVRWLRIDTEGMKCIAPDLSAQYSRTILRGGEVLVNVRGTLGGVAVASADMTDWNVSREVAVVPVDTKLICPEYVCFLIGTSASQHWLSGVKKGAAYTGINIEDLRLFPVSVPSIAEQRDIVQRIKLAHCEALRLESIYQRKIAALNELKQSLLHEAFGGNL